MKLPVLALFERSLRLETRSALMVWSRVSLLGIILFVLVSIQKMGRWGFYGAPGKEFLVSMVWVNVVFITLAGLSYFASAITEEKEELMLGLLRMTNLNPVAILLGKSTSRLIGAFLLLVVQLPFVLLAVTLGGVGLLQVMAAYATLLAYLFFLCNLALLFSVVFRNTATAGGIVLLLLFLFFVGHYWVAGFERDLVLTHQVNLQRGLWPAITKAVELWREATPGTRLAAIFETGFNGPVIGFQVVSNLTAGVVLFLMAWSVFDVCTRGEKDSSPARWWIWRRKSRRSRIPAHLLGARAITWKDFTFITGGRFGLLLKFVVMGLIIGLCNAIALEGNGKITREFEGLVLIWVSLISTAMWLVLEASRIFKDEIRWKTLSSLVTLPISTPELAYRKVVAALLGSLPLLAAFIAGIMIIPDKVGDFLESLLQDSSGAGFGALVVTVLQYILFLHLTAFLSLILKRGALPLAFAIQYIAGYFLLMFSALFLFRLSGGPGPMLFLTGFICVVLTIVLHLAIGHRLERAAAEE